MTEENRKHLNTINILLNQIGLITDKYEEIERITGERFNVFTILRKSADEIAHSNFIANLLDPKGSHGQGDVYLSLFIDYIKDKFSSEVDVDENTESLHIDSSIYELDYFKTETSKCETEKYAGIVDYENEQGGSIDIYLESGQKSIIIENKISAGDQPKQLLRYKSFIEKKENKGPILYLTTSGVDASKSSKGNLVEGIDYFRISYEEDILNWINLCVNASAAIPFVRETLRQYANLIKRITNQLSSNKMKDDILELFTDNNKKNMELLKVVYKSAFQESLDDFLLNSLMTEIVKEIENQKPESSKKLYPEKDSKTKRTILIRHDGLPVGMAVRLSFNKNRLLQIGLYVEDLNTFGKSLREEDISLFKQNKYSFINDKSWLFKKEVKDYPYSFESRENLINIYSDNTFKEVALEKIFTFIKPYLEEIKGLTLKLNNHQIK